MEITRAESVDELYKPTTDSIIQFLIDMSIKILI